MGGRRLQRRTRERMEQTGEGYMTARRAIIEGDERRDVEELDTPLTHDEEADLDDVDR